MIAVQGFYDNGKITLNVTAPMSKAEVLVIFPEKNKSDFTSSRFGVAKGKFIPPDDIDATNDEIAEMFGVKA